jgi:small subunit ribosomal protein S16
VVVADSESPRNGKFIENIGFYNPRTDPPTIEIKNERAVYWLSKGAQPSDAALRLLRKTGAMAEFAALKGEAPVEEAVAAVDTVAADEEIAAAAAEEVVAEDETAAVEEAVAESTEEVVAESTEEVVAESAEAGAAEDEGQVEEAQAE